MRHSVQRFLKSRDGTTSLEFAVIGPVFVLLLLGIFSAALLLWSKAAVQLAASQAARCVAVRSADCSDPDAYVSSILETWGVSAMVKLDPVSVQADTSCNRTTGRFSSVTVTGTGNVGSGYVNPFANVILTASACYPSKV